MTDARHSDAYHDRRAVETTNVPAQDPGLPDDKPDQCPECGTTVFDFDPNHCDGISMGPAWLCTGCKWGTFSANR